MVVARSVNSVENTQQQQQLTVQCEEHTTTATVQCEEHKKLRLVDQNWLERDFSGFLLRTLLVGRRQHSESIEVSLDNME